MYIHWAIHQPAILKTALSTNVDGKAITYKHNALGNRVAKLIDGQVVEKYLWLNKTTLLATYDRDDNLVQRFEYTLGNTPTSYTQDGTKYYIVSDHLGSPRAITDGAGNILKAFDYDSFGNVISDTNPSLTIPFGFAGGDTNLYGYVLNDPVNFTDPDGLRFRSMQPSSGAGGTYGQMGPGNNGVIRRGGVTHNPHHARPAIPAGAGVPQVPLGSGHIWIPPWSSANRTSEILMQLLRQTDQMNKSEKQKKELEKLLEEAKEMEATSCQAPG